MSMESYTDAEEIKRLIPIYEKTAAHNMVEALEKKLEELGEVSPSEPPVLGETPKLVAKPELTHTYEGPAEPEKLKKEYDAKALYEMKEAGLTWSEVAEKTGVKTPWIKAAIYRKENDLPKV